MMQAVGMWLASVLVPLGGMRLTLTIVVRDRHGPERQAFCPNLVPEDFSLTHGPMAYPPYRLRVCWSRVSALMVRNSCIQLNPGARTVAFLGHHRLSCPTSATPLQHCFPRDYLRAHRMFLGRYFGGLLCGPKSRLVRRLPSAPKPTHGLSDD